MTSRASRTVLYIEDNPSNRKVMEHIFRLVDDHLKLACSGTEGLALARALRPDAILLDLQLPDLSGYEVARRLKADPELRGIPVIAVTSYALSGDDEQARQAGCDDYVAKPFRPRELLQRLARHLDATGP